MRGLLQLLRMLALQGGKLIDGIEYGLLDSGTRIVVGKGYYGLNHLVHAIRTRIAICDHVGARLETFIEQDEVNTPRIDTDRCRNLACRGTCLDAVDDMTGKGLMIPAVMPILADLRIVKTMYFLQDDLAVLKMSEYVTPRRGSDIDC